MRAAVSALKYYTGLPTLPADFSIPATRDADMLDFLHYIFGFQVCTFTTSKYESWNGWDSDKVSLPYGPSLWSMLPSALGLFLILCKDEERVLLLLLMWFLVSSMWGLCNIGWSWVWKVSRLWWKWSSIKSVLNLGYWFEGYNPFCLEVLKGRWK